MRVFSLQEIVTRCLTDQTHIHYDEVIVAYKKYMKGMRKKNSKNKFKNTNFQKKTFLNFFEKSLKIEQVVVTNCVV